MARLLLKAALFGLLVLCLQCGIRIAIILGVHRHVFNHIPGPCRIVPGVDFGSEDIATTSEGIAFISSGVKTTATEWETRIKSRIFTFDFNHPEQNVREVDIVGEAFDKENSNLIGMSIWENEDTGKVTLYVVNRPLSKASVEVFEYREDTNALVHKETVTSDNIYRPNDLVVVGDRRFYVTNDLWFGTLLEIFSPIPTGTVAYYDGQKAELVASGLGMADGINRSPDGRYVYVAELFDGEVNIFETSRDGSLTLVKKINMHASVDNIEVDKKTGDLWLGCLPQLYRVLLIGDENDRNKGSSQVLKVSLDKELNADVREVLKDDGQLLRGSTVACPYGRQMLVGTVKSKMLHCQLLAY